MVNLKLLKVMDFYLVFVDFFFLELKINIFEK